MAEGNGTQLGKAYVQIVPSMQGLASELRRAFGDSMPDGHKFGSSLGGKVVSGFGSTIKKGFALAAKAGIATISAASAGIGAIVKSSASAYADYEQNIGGIETLFKDNADTIVKYASEAYKTAGISANDYMQNVTSFSASLLQGLGGDTAQAAEIANEAMVDMSDNANKMGTDISSIQNAYQGFAKQNYTMLDNLKLGYGGTQSEMARLINDSGVLGDSIKVDEKTVNSVSFDKMIEAIHKVQTDLDITGTTSKEAATTVSGSLGSVKAAWANLMAGMGDKNADLKNLIKEMVSTVKTFAKNILPVIKQALSGVTTLISELAPDIAAELPQLVSDLLPQLIEAGTQIFQALVKGISDNIGTITQAAITAITTIATALIQNTGPLVQALATIITTIAQALPTILPGLINAIVEQIPTVIQAVIDCMPAIIDGTIQIVTAIAEALVDNIDLIIDGAVQIIDALTMSLSDSDTAAKLAQSALEIIGTLTMELLKNLPDILADGILIAVELIKGIAQGMVDYFAPVSDALSDMLIDLTDWFSRKWNDFKEWGSDMIQAFIDGIKEKWQSLKDTVCDVASSVKDFLGFSEPDKGPLSNFHTFAPDMMDLFAKGIADNEDTITMQFNRSLQPLMDTDIIPPSFSALPEKGVNNSGNDTMNKIIALLETYFPQLAQQGNIYLDGDKLTSKVDGKLGERVTSNERRLASV
ncbi:phage tail protein [Ruminococcus bicirculans (ex Wegman et al. 2014)]|uniref:phage tail protein n=1 Tax=Ruminococcus bicirculans (ex Wegman et al. 2014) TaxID=1160721 RepID=UPI003A90A554